MDRANFMFAAGPHKRNRRGSWVRKVKYDVCKKPCLPPHIFSKVTSHLHFSALSLIWSWFPSIQIWAWNWQGPWGVLGPCFGSIGSWSPGWGKALMRCWWKQPLDCVFSVPSALRNLCTHIFLLPCKNLGFLIHRKVKANHLEAQVEEIQHSEEKCPKWSGIQEK